jgi:hypothetical protein
MLEPLVDPAQTTSQSTMAVVLVARVSRWRTSTGIFIGRGLRGTSSPAPGLAYSVAGRDCLRDTTSSLSAAVPITQPRIALVRRCQACLRELSLQELIYESIR